MFSISMKHRIQKTFKLQNEHYTAPNHIDLFLVMHLSYATANTWLHDCLIKKNLVQHEVG